MAELRENEQKTLLALERLRGRCPVDQLVKTSGLAHAAVMRAALSLAAKRLLKTHERKQTTVALTKEGSYHAKKGLPERRLLNSLIKLGGEASVDEAAKKAGLEKKFLNIALGWLSRKGWATIKKKERILKSLREPLTGNDEKLLSLLGEKDSVIVEDLSQELQKAVSRLRKRNVVDVSK